MKKLFVILFIVISIISCDSYNRKLDGINYSVGWVNMPELTNIKYHYSSGLRVGILMQRITDVYWNSNYNLVQDVRIPLIAY